MIGCKYRESLIVERGVGEYCGLNIVNIKFFCVLLWFFVCYYGCCRECQPNKCFMI